jgi:hypothetical protein
MHNIHHTSWLYSNALALQQVLFSLQSFLRIAAGELPSEIPKLNSTPRPCLEPASLDL